MKSENWIVVELGAALLLMALLSFFVEPRYEKGVWFTIGVFASGLSLVLGYKFGKNMPQQAGDVRDAPPAPIETTDPPKVDG